MPAWAGAVSTLGDEILDFYQPDELLTLEDVIPDLEVSTPEQATEELRRCVRTALKCHGNGVRSIDRW